MDYQVRAFPTYLIFSNMVFLSRLACILARNPCQEVQMLERLLVMNQPGSGNCAQQKPATSSLLAASIVS
jgi:hypothetical protein